MVSLTLMYRRPKFLDILLDIRCAMSAEAGNDIAAFVEMIRIGGPIPARSTTVTRVDGSMVADAPSTQVVGEPRIDVVKE